MHKKNIPDKLIIIGQYNYELYRGCWIYMLNDDAHTPPCPEGCIKFLKIHSTINQIYTIYAGKKRGKWKFINKISNMNVHV